MCQRYENMSRYINIALAGVVIRVEYIYDYIREYCCEYITDMQESFTVATAPSDIEYERERSAAEDKKESIPVRQYNMFLGE